MGFSESPTITPAGRSVTLYNDELLGELRRLANVPDDFANEGWSFDDFECGGGKGGCPIAFIGSKYLIKELGSSDHQSLLDVSQAYVEHVRDGDTLLCIVLLHFEDTATGRKFFAMRSSTGDGPFLALYDLKGCNDDKTLELMGEKIRKRRSWWASTCTCGGTYTALGRYNAGKKAAAKADLVVTAEQRADVMRRLERDTKWLAEHQLMDYSLLVGVKTGPAGFMDAAKGQLGQAPFVRTCKDGTEVAVCVAIIDFLQQWTLVKKAAEIVKVFEANRATVSPQPYAERFLRHFGDRFKAAPNPELLSRRDRQALTGLDSKQLHLLVSGSPQAAASLEPSSRQLLDEEEEEEEAEEEVTEC
jgi:hypothetical protein